MRIERECNKCVHRKENGCEKWDCEFKPYAPTREEALAILNAYDMSDDNEDVEFKSALALAIKALKKEPCKDAVSRQAVIIVVKDWWKNGVMAIDDIYKLPPVEPTRNWIPVSERLPETNNENEIDEYNVLLWVANKTHPEREPQIYLGKLKKVNGDDGSGNFWGIKTKPCDWTIWGWCYFNEPEVIAWMPLPDPYKTKMESENGN